MSPQPHRSLFSRTCAALAKSCQLDPTRDAWVDCVKGLTILLVVFHHAQEGVHTSLGLSGQFHYFYEVLSPIRMPLFFLVAGLFANRAIQGPFDRFLDSKVIHFLYFYLLWSSIIFLFRFSMNGITNNQTELTDILKIFWDPLPTIWFLYALLLSFFILRSARNISPAYVISFAAIVQAVALFNGSAWTGIVIIDKLSVIFVYFAIGVFAADWIKGFARDMTPLRLIVAVGAFIIIAAYARWNSVILTPLWYFAISASSAAVIIGASVFLVRLRWATPLTVIGNHSFQIYLTHFLAVAGVRIVLIKLGITSPVIILLLAVPAAVAFALVLNAATSAGVGRFLFERPAAFRLSRPVSPPMPTPEH